MMHPSNAISVRELDVRNEEELRQAAEIRRLLPEYGGFFMPVTVREGYARKQVRHYQKAKPGGKIFVATDGKRIVGVCFGHPATNEEMEESELRRKLEGKKLYYVYANVVLPKYQRGKVGNARIGNMLLAKHEEHARQKGFDGLLAETIVSDVEHNDSGRRHLESNGFQHIHTTKGETGSRQCLYPSTLVFLKNLK